MSESEKLQPTSSDNITENVNIMLDEKDKNENIENKPESENEDKKESLDDNHENKELSQNPLSNEIGMKEKEEKEEKYSENANINADLNIEPIGSKESSNKQYMVNVQKEKKDDRNEEIESKEKTDENSDINQNLENKEKEKAKEKSKEDKKDVIEDKIGDISFIKQNEGDEKNFLGNSFLDDDILKLTSQIKDITKNATKKKKKMNCSNQNLKKIKDLK